MWYNERKMRKDALIRRDAVYNVTVTDENYISTTYTVSGTELADGFAVSVPKAHTSAVAEYSVSS